METGGGLGVVGQPAFKLLLAPGTRKLLVPLKQLFKPFYIYLLNPPRPCLFHNKLQRKSVSRNQLEGVLRRNATARHKSLQLFQPALERFAEAIFLVVYYFLYLRCLSAQLGIKTLVLLDYQLRQTAQCPFRQPQRVAKTHRPTQQPADNVAPLDIARDYSIHNQHGCGLYVVGYDTKSFGVLDILLAAVLLYIV